MKVQHGIPESWEVVKLSELATINELSIKRGLEPPRINYIDIASVSTGQITEITPYVFENAPGRARRLVRHGDIIWSCVRPNRKSYSLVLNPPANLIVSTGFAVITAHQVPYTYLYHALTTDDFVGYLTNHARGAAYPAVTSNDFENALVLRPARDLLISFRATVDDIYEQKNTLEHKNVILRRTRDLLLPRLVSGEIDVTDLEIDAEERIA